MHRGLVGVELGPTSWLAMTQERIDAFAAATDDPQWIHIDEERAAAGVTSEATVECEGVEKPVCVADLLVLGVS